MNDFLDRCIAEQASYYGPSVEQFTKTMDALCNLQELADNSGWEIEEDN